MDRLDVFGVCIDTPETCLEDQEMFGKLSCLTLAGSVLLAGPASAGLIITGVFDGPLAGGEPKVVELYVTANGTDLSMYGVGAANNGGGTDGVESLLTGTANAGDFIYIVDENNNSANDATFGDFQSYFGFLPTFIFNSNSGTNGGGAAVNGDDAIELFFAADGTFDGNEIVTDTFGNISGAFTSYLDGWAYRIDNTGPDGASYLASNWTFSGTDVNDNKTTNVGPSAFPIGTYVPEPGTAALAAAGLALTLLRRRSA